MSGIELQQQLNARGATIPIVFITGHGDVPMAVEAMQAGAFDFLQKPFSDNDLIARVQRAIEHNATQRARLHTRNDTRDRLVTLTPRERDVVGRLLSGASTRQIAESTGLTVATVNTYLKRIFAKLGVHSRVELVARVTGTRGVIPTMKTETSQP